MMSGIQMLIHKVRIRRYVRTVTEAIYAEQFDLNTLVEHIGNSISDEQKLLSAYVLIQAVADSKIQGREIQIDNVLENMDVLEKRLKKGDERQAVLQLHKSEAEASLLEAEIISHTDRLAPADSYQGIIYRAEKKNKGPKKKK